MTALDLVKQFEGCKLTVYLDIGGIPTIGFGHVGKDVYIGMPDWTQDQADEALEHDLDQAGALLYLYSPGVPDPQREALIDFVYNLGIGHYRTSTLCQLVNAKSWPEAKVEILKWDHSNGKVIPGLLARREAEAVLMGD